MPTNIMTRLLAGTAVSALLTGAAFAADANARPYDIPQQDTATALQAYAMQSGKQVLFPYEAVKGKQAPQIKGDYSDAEVLALLAGSAGLKVTADDGKTVTLRPQSAAAAEGGDEGTVQALIVTAQKREENIQDVPIAMSAFSQADLTRSQVAGGPDLITQVPNMTFTKTNFSSYSIQLRGIGTQAISATVDPAVAVAFNNTPFVRNRFFEQEFYDLERVEVLRGPQGTLYGRNATAGVVNLISAKPKFTYEAKLSADVGNYNSHRLEGMLNIPLAEDKVALRIAGAWTKRDGYSTNQVTGNPIDGRDLWSTRVSLRFAPTDKLNANLIWEHFNEDDDRIRSGKQLCKNDIVTNVAGFDTPDFYQTLAENGQRSDFSGVQASFSQGCKPASLYSPDSFQKTNSLALPYFVPLGAVGLPIRYVDGHPVDPYASRTQSTDLRVIEAAVDPSYRAKTDIAELQVAYDLTDKLTLTSETAWGSDFIFSTQDYNRFAGAPNAWSTEGAMPGAYVDRGILTPSGVFCDPQIGCSDRLVAEDLSTARSRQFSQELRLASNFDGAFNFSLGANFLRYDTEDKYYVFINSISMISAYMTTGPFDPTPATTPYFPNVTDNRDCLTHGMVAPNYTQVQPILQCTYIDPNPIGNLNDLGHNYFLSKNPYKLISYAVFGEAYYKLADNLKLTAGLRWTVDKKEAPLVPSWLMASDTVGYPVFETVRQEWREPTGRLALDWKPDLSFTDQTLVYGSYSHGYKAGGMNPPPYGKAIYDFGNLAQQGTDVASRILAQSALHPKTFDPEYVNAFELGAKNTLLDGRMTLNLAAFYYDYKSYQLSQIVDRSAVTNNFDAKIWGLELESNWDPIENLRLGLKLGYEKTRVANGMKAIDVMDRTAGTPGWVVYKPFPSIPSNCVLPAWLFVGNPGNGAPNPSLVNVGGKGGGNAGGCENAYLLGLDPATGRTYTPFPYDAWAVPGQDFRRGIDYAQWSTHIEDYPCLTAVPTSDYPGVDPACLAAMSNNGEGFYKNLGGHELPNAPHITATLTADYTIPMPNNWLATLHTDLYYQSESWARIFNTAGYDKLKAYNNVNLAAIFTNEDAGWKVMAYVKNVFNRDNITGAFLNSDDSGLTTNVFLNEPRLYGLRVTKDLAGGPWWTGGDPTHTGSSPFTVELGGIIEHFDAPTQNLHYGWVDALPAAIAPANVQNGDWDTGDGRWLKLTYRPQGSPWSVSGGVRYGRTNKGTTRANADETALVKACRFSSSDYLSVVCDPDFEVGGVSYYYAWYANVQAPSWSDAEAKGREEHTIVDFAVGRDFGLGGQSSTLSVGLRGAELQSSSYWAANAQTDWNIPDGWLANIGRLPSSNHVRHVFLNADRKFKGAGPVVAWEGGLGVWGGDQWGRVTLDWSTTAGALFGTREARITGTDTNEFRQGLSQINVNKQGGYSTFISAFPVVSTTSTPISIRRSKDATVPVVDLSLGLSYEAGRIKVGTGYRWERYFDVLDVGQDEEKKADRTIDGPYFKIAVGFGG